MLYDVFYFLSHVLNPYLAGKQQIPLLDSTQHRHSALIVHIQREVGVFLSIRSQKKVQANISRLATS